MSALADPELAARDLEARRAWLTRELELQDHVATRAQLTFGGYAPNDIRRSIRRREMCAVHRGVYVTHTGPLTWRQRAWAAVLYAEPAALCGPSVLQPRRTDDTTGPIHVAIDHARRLDPPPGVVVHRVVGLSRQTFAGTPSPSQARGQRSPPSPRCHLRDRGDRPPDRHHRPPRSDHQCRTHRAEASPTAPPPRLRP